MLTKPFWAFCPPGPATVSHKAPWAHPAGSGPPPLNRRAGKIKKRLSEIRFLVNGPYKTPI